MAIASSFVVIAGSVLTGGAAQIEGQKRVTSVRVGSTTEGSRVVVVSDSALNDYEAYRRGDRFYVKLPAANLTSAQSGFRGTGFEDAQVQKVADGVILSFRLQPGTTARVDQRFNKLDVVFSTSGSRDSASVPSSTGNDSFQSRELGSSRREPTNEASGSSGTLDGQSSRQGQSSHQSGATPQTSPGAESPVPESQLSPLAQTQRSPRSEQSSQTPGVVAGSQGAPFGETALGAWLTRYWFVPLIALILLVAFAFVMMARRRSRVTSQSNQPVTPTGDTPGTVFSEADSFMPSSPPPSLPLEEETGFPVDHLPTVPLSLEPDGIIEESDMPESTSVALSQESKSLISEEQAADYGRVGEQSYDDPSSQQFAQEGQEPTETDHLEWPQTFEESRDSLSSTSPSTALPPQESDWRSGEGRRQLKEEALLNAVEELERRSQAAEQHRMKAAKARQEVEEDNGERIEAVNVLEQEALGLDEPVVTLYKLEEEARTAPEIQNLPEAEGEVLFGPEEEVRFRLEAEALRRAGEERARQRAAAEAARRLADEDARRREEETLRQQAQEGTRGRVEEAVRRRLEEKGRRAAEQEALRLVDDERLRLEAEERGGFSAERLRLEQEALMEAAAELTRRRSEAEEARKKTEEETRLLQETQQRIQAEEEKRRQVEEERTRLEEEARRRAEEERQRLEEMRRRVEAEQQRLEETRLRAEQEEQRLAELEAVKKKAEQRTRECAEQEQRIRAEIEALREAELEQRKRIEEETRLRTEAESRLREEEARRVAAEQERLKLEEEARRLAEEARQRAEQEVNLRAAAEARLKEEEARQRSEEEERRKREEKSQRLAEEARLRAEEEADRRAAAEVRLREERARRQAEEDARNQARESALKLAEEARRRKENEIRRRLDAEARLIDGEARLHAADEERPRVEEIQVEDARQQDTDDQQASAAAAGSAEMNQEADAPWTGVPVGESSDESLSGDQSPAVAPLEEQTPTEGSAEYVEGPHWGRSVEPQGDDGQVPADLMKSLGSIELEERAEALRQLAHVNTDEAFTIVSNAFDDEAVEIRNAAAQALFNMQSDRAASFTRALREGSPERRRKIGSALATSGLASDAIANLTGESRELTYDAFSLLFLMAKSGEVQPLLQAIEDHPNIEVRLAVIKLLALSGQAEIVPAFRRLAVRGSLPSEVRSAVMEAIYQISSQARESTPSAA